MKLEDTFKCNKLVTENIEVSRIVKFMKAIWGGNCATVG